MLDYIVDRLLNDAVDINCLVIRQAVRIVDIQLERVKALLEDRRIELEFSDEARELLAEKGYDPHYGARPLKRVIQRMLQDPLAMRILEGEFPEGSKVYVDAPDSAESLSFESR